MILSGFTDEAGDDLTTQIRAVQELGWNHLSARNIDGTSIHDLSEEAFDRVVGQLEAANIQVIEVGSMIGSWAKTIDSDFMLTLDEIRRCIPRMKRLGTRLVRVMSYAQKPWGEDQMDQERFRRLREIVDRFADAGIQAAHENCMNWGGFSPDHSLRLIEEVPGLKLIFDTGNPAFQMDRSKPEPFPWQDPVEFYQAIKEHVVHVHIKDCLNPPTGGTEPEAYTFPGKGQARLDEILTKLAEDGYNGAFAIEPHVGKVFHKADAIASCADSPYRAFVDYGRAFEEQVSQIFGRELA